jgi:lysyl-tRNA synthetase class I
MYYYPLSVVDKPAKACPPQIPFKFLVMMCQMEDLLTIDNILQKAQITQKVKGIDTKIPQDYLRRRLDQTKNWLVELKHMIDDEKDPKEKKNLMMKADFFSVPETITNDVKVQLDEKQKLALQKLAVFLNSIQEITDDNLKDVMMKIQKEIDIKPMAMFQAIYLILIGSKAGPRLGPFMTLLDLDWLRERFNLK